MKNRSAPSWPISMRMTPMPWSLVEEREALTHGLNRDGSRWVGKSSAIESESLV